MSERGNRDGSTRRSSYRRSISETSLPQHYLAQLEEKRKQLDESIHKYIASKEREYKVFERDIRQQHRSDAGSSNGTNGSSKRRGSSESTPNDNHGRGSAVDALLDSSARRDSEDGAVEAEDDTYRQLDRSAMAGLKDRRASLERDQDFAGLFTPSYLSALGNRDSRKITRTSSDPLAGQSAGTEEASIESGSVPRVNSDGVMQAKPKRPSHLALVQRTSSSGSSADGKLASAMKSSASSSSQQLAQPKRKRVSLAVGDTIVAPSDSVPLSLSHNSSSSHSRIRSLAPEREFPVTMKEPDKPREERRGSIEEALMVAEDVALANAIGAEKDQSPEPLAAATDSPVPSGLSSPKPGSSTRLDPDGDLFGLEEEEEDAQNPSKSTFTPDEELDDIRDSAIESDDEVAGRIDEEGKKEYVETESDATRYDPTTGLIPEPADGADSAVPYLAFGRGSAVASQQPTQPGFRRPSVVNDPIYRGSNYRNVERDAVKNEIYGSSFNRPSSKSSFTAGSLGESYMAQHAEGMARIRSSRSNSLRS